MNLPKAIKVNEDNEAFFRMDGFDECADAVQLGIEALKMVQYQREFPVDLPLQPLPGETKE